MTRHLSPRRLSRPVQKATAVTKQIVAAQRRALAKSGMQSARSRGLKRGGAR